MSSIEEGKNQHLLKKLSIKIIIVYVCLKLLKQVFGNLISCPLFEWSVTRANQASIPISQSDYLYKYQIEQYSWDPNI